MRAEIIISLIAIIFIGLAGFAFAAEEEESYTEQLKQVLIDIGIMEADSTDPSFLESLQKKLAEINIIDEESQKWTYLGKDLYKREFDDGVICYAYGTTRECVKPGLWGWFTGYEVKLKDRE